MKRRRVLFIRLSQFRIFAGKLFVTLTLISAVCLVILSKLDNSRVNHTGDIFSAVLNPLIRVMQFPADGLYYITQKIKHIAFVYAENKELNQKNAQMERLHIKLNALETENKLLSEMLNYTAPLGVKYITAKVISGTKDGFSHSITVYVPNKENVRIGQIAMYNEQVVGRVDSVDGQYVKILLITDIDSKIPVVIKRNRERAILSGNNTSILNLLYTIPSADIKVGDQVVTSGVGGVFPSELLIGNVTKVSSSVLEVTPAFSIEKIEYVQIIDYRLDMEKMSEEEK